MSQHSFSIANEVGSAFRADVNAALQALASCSRGAAAPGTTYAGQVWDDSTANVQKKRNAANAAWIVKATLDETFVLSRSSNTILGLSDYGKTIVATGTFTQTVTAAATLTDGWWIEYRNDGTGIITIDPNGAETIDGATTLNLYAGESCVINCNGAAFKSVGRTVGLVLIERKSVSAVATVDFTVGIDATFEEYIVKASDVIPATAGADLWLRVSEDGGSTFKAGASDYHWNSLAAVDGVSSASSNNADAKAVLQGALSNAATTASCEFELRVVNPAGTSRNKFFTHQGTALRDITASLATWIGGIRFKLDANAINAIRFLMSSGNVTSGVFTLYGVRKA